MVDVNELKKKFPSKKPSGALPGGPMHQKSSKASVKAIAREYELKKAALQAAGPVTLRRGPVFYGVLVLIMIIVGGLVLSALKNGVGFGKARIERKPLQAVKSINVVAEALGRYKFHVGAYPTTEEGLAPLAAKAYRKQGWDGPYINHVVADPWGHAYVYETRPEGGHPVLYSKGPNGRAGDDDDVLPDQEAFERAFRDTSWTNGWAPYRLRGVVVAPDAETKRRVQEEMKQYDR